MKTEALSMDLGMFDWKRTEMYFYRSEYGKRVLVIDDVNTSCRCTSGVFERTGSVRKTVDITVVYKAEYPSINKTITVYCNSPVSLLQLKIKGDAK
ncbi:MAG: DUF1573 domain-containing protein [Bacteroides sp.]